jgi:hypothetical protein
LDDLVNYTDDEGDTWGDAFNIITLPVEEDHPITREEYDYGQITVTTDGIIVLSVRSAGPWLAAVHVSEECGFKRWIKLTYSDGSKLVLEFEMKDGIGMSGGETFMAVHEHGSGAGNTAYLAANSCNSSEEQGFGTVG